MALKLAWHFSEVNPRFKNREATQGEFFASGTPLRSFVREAVQNSLDARKADSRGPVEVRIFVSGTSRALTPAAARPWLRGGWVHFESETAGLREVPSTKEKCPFLVYEDFGTTGLTGDTTQFSEGLTSSNPFYYFFRAEGQSGKVLGGRGRWGLGKFVFPRSSRIRSFFALTVRCDDGRRLLVGQSILRSHTAAGKSWTPDGWYGHELPLDQAPPPVEDNGILDAFERDFLLERKQQPGLSLVIPWYDASWTVDRIAECLIEEYFNVLVDEQLVVTVEDSESSMILNSHSITDVLARCGADVRERMLPLLRLRQWAACCEYLRFPPGLLESAGSGQSHEPDREHLARLRHQLRDEGRLALRVPVEVQFRHGELRDTYFDVVLERVESPAPRRPVFVRDGIVVSDVRTQAVRDIVSIVRIDEPILAAFLGDAENPAHTEWHEESSHFQGKYRNGGDLLRRVRLIVPQLCQLLEQDRDEDDRDLLLDVFCISTAVDQPGVPVSFPSRRSGNGLSERLSGLRRRLSPDRSRLCRVSRRKGGFCITGTRPEASETGPEDEFQIEMQIAYDGRHGHPLRRYRESDFRLDQNPIRIECRGAKLDITGPNRLLLTPLEERYEVVITGFDVNRDLYLSRQLVRQSPEAKPVRVRRRNTHSEASGSDQ